ncbi:MAG: archease [Anaerolineaceae bacterium]
MNSKVGFEEVNHTADRAIRVWGADLPEMLTQAALGMYTLMGIKPDGRCDTERLIVLEAFDDETLVVGLLSELLSFLESERLIFSRIFASLEAGRADIRLAGYRLRRARVSIKAVTYHDLQVLRTGDGYETTIVFDV